MGQAITTYLYREHLASNEVAKICANLWERGMNLLDKYNYFLVFYSIEKQYFLDISGHIFDQLCFFDARRLWPSGLVLGKGTF